MNVRNSSILKVLLPSSQQTTILHTSVVWDDCTQSIYYIDQFAAKNQPSIYRHDYKTETTYAAHFVGQMHPTFIVPARDCETNRNVFVVGANQYAGIIEWDGKSSRVKVIGPLFDIADHNPSGLVAFGRQNESGRFFFSTSNTKYCNGPDNSSLYSYSKEKGIQHLAGGFAMTTGLAFNSGKIYHTDSCKRIITQFHTYSDGSICKLSRLKLIFSQKSLIHIFFHHSHWPHCF